MRWQVSRRYRKFPTLDTSVVEVGQELITASTIFCHLQKKPICFNVVEG